MSVEVVTLLAEYVIATGTYFAELIEANTVQIFQLAAVLLFVGICKFIARKIFAIS